MNRLLHCSLFLLAFQGTGTLIAQDSLAARRDTVYALPPVVITATEARERQTPATFTNLTAAELMERYSVQDVPVLLSDLPSITTYSENGNGIGYNYINLRGFEQRRISVMINGVPQNDPEDHSVYWIDFPDLMASTGNIQVQRGAGSAFYGPPAIGGSVNLVTTPFIREPGITLESMFGFQQFSDSSLSTPLVTRKLGAAFNSGLVRGHYMFYAHLGRIESDGYRTNSWVDLNSYFFGAMRVDEAMTTRFHFYGGPITDGLAYNGLPKFVGDNPVLRRQNLSDWSSDPSGTAYAGVTVRRPQETESFSQPHYEAINQWRVAPGTTLNNTLFYISGDGYFDYDASWADTSMLRIGTAYGIPTAANPTNTLVRAFVGNRQWGWLPRLDLEQGDGSLTLGAELRFHRSVHWGKIQYAEGLPANFNPDYHFYEYNGEKDILSLYAHELFRVEENLTLMGDIQFVRNRYAIRNEKYLGNDFSLRYFFANPRLGLNYNMSDAWNGYVSIAYTSREPTLRNLYAAEDSYFGARPQFRADTVGGTVRYDFTQPLAKPEHLLDLEVGTAYRGPQAQLNLDVYWMEFADELVESGQVDIFGQPVTGNADRTRHIGLEVDGSVNLTPSLSLGGNVTLSHNVLVRHVTYIGVIATDGNTEYLPVTLDGNPIAGFPDALANLRLSYRREGLTGSLFMKYVGPFYTDNFKNAENRNEAYRVWNAEIVWQVPERFGCGLTLRAEVHNLFNALYFANGQGNAFYPAAERNYLLGISVKI